jgi:hypothetical protein
MLSHKVSVMCAIDACMMPYSFQRIELWGIRREIVNFDMSPMI